VHGERNGPQAGPGQHHHRIGRRDAAAFGNKFGLSRVGEADGEQLRLGHWPGDQRRCHALAGDAGGQFQAVERAAGAGQIGFAGHDLAGIINLNQWQRAIEGSGRGGRIRQHGNRPIPYGADRTCVTNGKEWRQPGGDPLFPGAGDNFRANAGRIADRNGQWRRDWCHQR
jgi:hypothetical protein